jgi:HPt (histidine-containing phosphotransfer) domain-containing protein
MSKVSPAIRKSGGSEKDVLDIGALKSRIHDNPESLQKLKQMFFKDHPPLIQSIQKAAEQEDNEKLVYAAYSLKSMLSYLFAPRGYRAALELEVTAMSQNMKNVSSKVIFLEAELERIAVVLDEME